MEELRNRVNSAFQRKALLTKRSALWIKVGLVLVGSLLSGVAAVFSQSTIWPLTSVQIFGLVGLALAFGGSTFVVITEEDTSTVLNDARRALEESVNLDLRESELYETLRQYEDATNRLISLYTAMSNARGTLEQAIIHNKTDEIGLIDACLGTMKRELRIALGFELSDFWTICVYKAVPSARPGLVELELVANDRSVPCETKDARRWREGVGVGGIAYAKDDEVVVPDLDAPAVGSVFKLDDSLIKPEDRSRYKSLFAVPISVGSDDRPWGVALATSDWPDYFGADDESAVDPEEAVRALAGMTALAVAICRGNHGGSSA